MVPTTFAWFVSYLFNDAFPPLACQDASFDLIYAISVFTHLDETIQFSWLRELQRLTKPGGLVVLTTHGNTHFHALPPHLQESVKQEGFLFFNSDGWKTIFPQWYQDSFHTADYIREHFNRYFAVCSILPAAMNNHQDVIILQRRDEPVLTESALPAWAQITVLERELRLLHRTVAAKDAHIGKLETLLERIAQGRVMRLMNYGLRK